MTDEELSISDATLIARLRKGWHTGIEAADRIEALIAERDHWSGVALREGVCMTCRGPRGAPESYGCSDCLNTGYCGEHHNTVADLGAKLAKAVEALGEIADRRIPDQPAAYDVDEADWARRQHTALRSIARATLAELKGKSHE